MKKFEDLIVAPDGEGLVETEIREFFEKHKKKKIRVTLIATWDFHEYKHAMSGEFCTSWRIATRAHLPHQISLFPDEIVSLAVEEE